MSGDQCQLRGFPTLPWLPDVHSFTKRFLLKEECNYDFWQSFFPRIINGFTPRAEDICANLIVVMNRYNTEWSQKNGILDFTLLETRASSATWCCFKKSNKQTKCRVSGVTRFPISELENYRLYVSALIKVEPTCACRHRFEDTCKATCTLYSLKKRVKILLFKEWIYIIVWI